MKLEFTKDGTLVLPVDLNHLPVICKWRDGEEVLRRKVEHHITLIGYGQGKTVKKVFADNPELKDKANTLANEMPFEYGLEEEGFCLQRDDLKTIVKRVDLPSASWFYKQLSELLGVAIEPQMMHVTLYTSDPAGKAGIGINSEAELQAAMEGTGKYRAWREK